MKTTIFAFFILLGTFKISSAQDFVIEYDFLNKTTKYFKISKKGDTTETTKPIAKQNQDIQLKVINYNEFALVTEADITNEEIIESSNPFSMFGALSPIFNTVSKSVLSGMFDGTGADVDDIDFGFGYSSKGNNDERLKAALKQYALLSSKMNELDALEDAIQSINYAIGRVKKIVYNPNANPNDIKGQTKSIVRDVLNNGDKLTYINFQRKYNTLTSRMSELSRAAKQNGNRVLAYEEHEDANLGFSSKESALTYEEVSAETEEMLKLIEEFENAYTSEELQEKLDELQELYDAVNTSNFTYTTSATAEGDRTNINVSFYEHLPDGVDKGKLSNSLKSNNKGDEDENFLRSESFKVRVKGGLKIVPSVGLTFPTYFNQNKEFYTIGDTLIAQTGGDNFVPNITAMINFYPYTGRAINFGGSFGIGIPVKAEKFAPQYMMGGALVLGQKYRIILSAGMSVGPVTTLRPGYEVGENISAFDDLETDSKYKVGFYSGISFTLGVGSE